MMSWLPDRRSAVCSSDLVFRRVGPVSSPHKPAGIGAVQQSRSVARHAQPVGGICPSTGMGRSTSSRPTRRHPSRASSSRRRTRVRSFRTPAPQHSRSDRVQIDTRFFPCAERPGAPRENVELQLPFFPEMNTSRWGNCSNCEAGLPKFVASTSGGLPPIHSDRSMSS
jgi:hypothetical protein